MGIWDVKSRVKHDYMSDTESILYEQVKDSTDEKDKIIKTLLERLADASRAAHRNSTY